MSKPVTLALIIATACAWPLAGDEVKRNRPAEFAKTLLAAVRHINTTHFTPTTESQLARWAIDGLFQEAKVPLPAETADQLKRFDKLTTTEKLRLLTDARAHLADPKSLRNNEDVAISLRAIFTGLEPGRIESGLVEDSGLRPPPEFIGSKGVGLKLEVDPTTGMLRVVTPIFGSPAHKAGIRAGDIITHFRLEADGDGKAKSAKLSTKGMTVEEGERMLLGQSGTRVTMIVIPAK